MESTQTRKSIAIVGAGISGITCAHLLDAAHHVTLFERESRLGGHTNTIEVPSPEGPVAVDTGFIVCNPRTYPLFYKLLDQWGVRLRDSDMSFGYSCDKTGLKYVGPSLRDFAALPSKFFDRRLLRLFREQKRFNKRAARDLQSGNLADLTLGEYLDRIDASPHFREHYLIPLAAAVWSSPFSEMLSFPASTFIRFFENHGMLDLKSRPTWQTLVGGSHAYLKAFSSRFRGTVRLQCPVAGIQRTDDAVHLHLASGEVDTFDRVVMATHADVTTRLLRDASDVEKAALSAWTYHANPMQLHVDASLMPADRRLWASWNYHRREQFSESEPVPITYYMNRLQGLTGTQDYFVSLNAGDHIDPAKVIASADYAHPGYSNRSIAAQQTLLEQNGTRNTYFCGAHLRYGFHEDGVYSAVQVARHFGVDL